MYDFIFNFFYRYHKKNRDFSPRLTAAISVATTIFFQLFMIVNVFTFFTKINILGKPFSQDYFTNKLYYLPFAMLYGYSFVLFYTHKRAMRIVNKYPQNFKVLTLENILLVLLIMIVPLLIGIWFLQYSR